MGVPFLTSHRLADSGWAVGVAALTVVVVTATTLMPSALLAIPAALVVYGMTKAWFRLMFFVVGAFFVFQSGDGLSVTKLGYLAGVVLAAVLAAHNIARGADRSYRRRVKPALTGASLVALWVLVPSLVQSVILNNVPLSMWARDGLTYLLISAGVVIGLDAAGQVSLRWARAITLGVGLLAAYGFATEWIQRRGLVEGVSATTSAQGGLLGSLAALTLPLTMCLALGLAQSRIRWGWLLLAPVFLLAVLVTGTRTGVVLAVAIVGVIGLRANKRVPIGRAVMGGVLGVGALALTLPLAGAAFSSERFVQQRIDQMARVLESGFATDASGVIRERATQYCLQIFNAHPLMGQGLGLYFPNPNPGGAAMNFSLDSWAVLPAKFGIIGTAVISIGILMIFHAFIRRGDGLSLYENTAVSGALITLLALIPFGTSPEDKGFAVVVALSALLVSAAARASQEGDEVEEAAPQRALAASIRSQGLLPGRR
ncbi:O-antigen ligase family protein [Arthrobacter sp. C152]